MPEEQQPTEQEVRAVGDTNAEPASADTWPSTCGQRSTRVLAWTISKEHR